MTERAGGQGGQQDELQGIYRLLVETVRDYAIFALDPDGYILTWNPGAERFKGYRAEEIIGRHFSVFYEPEDIAARKPEIELEQATAEGRVEDEGYRLRKDGTRFWANVVITALRDATGTLVGFAKVTRDLSERREAEEALRKSEQRFRLIVHSVADYAIYMLDPMGRIVSWNEGAERIKGYTREEIIGRHFSVFYPADDVAEGKPAVELQQAIEHGRFEDEAWRVRKDGSLFWANAIITALHGPDGRLVGYAKVTRDLTERKKSEERAVADARRIAEVESANRAKSDFLAAMSHELRTPLNAIAGYVDLLETGIRGPVNDRQVEDLRRIRSSQQHLLAIINDLLNFSRIEAGTVSYRLEEFSLASAADSVRIMIEPLADARRISVQWPSMDSDIVAYADVSKVEQILLNLLSNALKFTPPGGTVAVAVSEEGDRIAASVTDNGIGISADQLEDVFEPFVQVGRNLTSHHEGTGLGLAISRDLARAMGGDLVARSTPGEGSTFTLLLPRNADSDAGADPSG